MRCCLSRRRLVAEVSTDIMGQQPDLVDLQVQGPGDIGPQTERALVGIPDRQPFPAPARHGDTGFQGRVLDQVGLVFLFQDHICLFKSLLHVTAVQGIRPGPEPHSLRDRFSGPLA